MAGWITEQSFGDCLAFSRARAKDTDLDTIQAIIPGCVEVLDVDSDMKLQRLGIDYIARLRGGAEILIDGKARTKGCSTYWKSGPELALETWSVKPEGGSRGVIGWTLSEFKETDYTLHTFDPSDCVEAFLLPFQLLRAAFVANLGSWRSQFKVQTQSSDDGRSRWKSECVFVPAGIVLAAIATEMQVVAIGEIPDSFP